MISLIYLVERKYAGITLSSDLLALLPERDDHEVGSLAARSATDSLARDAVFVFGHHDRGVANEAAADFARDLLESGLVADVSGQRETSSYEKLGKLLFAHRAGLLSDDDRRELKAGRAGDIYKSALAQIFSPIGIIDSRLLAADPFQLFPRYLASLRLMAPGDPTAGGAGLAEPGGPAYAVVSARFADEPYALSFQKRFAAWLDAWQAARDADHGAGEGPLRLLKAGAIFYAHAGAKEGLQDATVIGGVTVVGLVALILLAFGSLQPLGLSLLSIVAGLAAASAASLLLFKDLHFVAVMFGAGLIGISVDYSFHYCCERFGQGTKPMARLNNMLPGATLGVVTSAIGFLTLAWAPFPGLRQIALFSVVGLAVAYFTVVLWFPVLDRSPDRQASAWLMAVARFPRRFWRDPGLRRSRQILLGILGLSAAVGATMVSASDNIRAFQALSPELRDEERAVREIVGFGTEFRFFVVTGADDEELLRREEGLRERLEPLIASGAVAGVLAVSEFVPSAPRQAENRALVSEHLGPALRRRLATESGLPFDVDGAAGDNTPLTLAEFLATAPRLMTDRLILDLGEHGRATVVLLQGVGDTGPVRAVAEALQGVDYVDPVADISALFRRYRKTALLLLGVSILLMAPVLLWRYGRHGSLWVLGPPTVSVLLAPCLVALTGEPLTFFNVMALILVFAIGIDYALFCREAETSRLDATSLANGLAATTTVLSFGLLAFSGIPVVHSFGLTVLIGILLAFLLAPLAEKSAGEVANSGERA